MRFAFIAVLSHGRIGCRSRPVSGNRPVMGLLMLLEPHPVRGYSRNIARYATARIAAAVVEGSREAASLIQCGHVIRKSVAAQRRVRWRPRMSLLMVWTGAPS